MREVQAYFWVYGNRNNQTEDAFAAALQKEVDRIVPISGTYRWNIKVDHYYNEKTGTNVMINSETKQLEAAWKLSPDQIKYLKSNWNIQ